MAAIIETNGKKVPVAVKPEEESAWGYGYGTGRRHLSDEEMIEAYQLRREEDPGALIAVDDHDCGHWTLTVYKTDIEKQLFFARKLAELWGHFAARLAAIK
ncbi:MAG: hypothetical protein AABM67_09040 [Acidobacteriota bacterium]